MASNAAAPPPRRPSAPLPSSFDYDPKFQEESGAKKIWRRVREEPLIPLGLVLTVSAFVGAVRAIKQGESRKANMMFRRRIYAQGFTILAMVGGGYYWKGDRQKRREYEQTVADRKAAERREAWLRELEARDAEEQAFEERMARGKAILEEREKARKKTGKIGRGVAVEHEEKKEKKKDGGSTVTPAATAASVAAAAAADASSSDDEAVDLKLQKEIIKASSNNDLDIRRRKRMRGKLADALASPKQSQHTPEEKEDEGVSQRINIADAVKQKAAEKARQAKDKAVEVVKDVKGSSKD